MGNFAANFKNKCKDYVQKNRPDADKVPLEGGSFLRTVRFLYRWGYNLRSVLLAIPVAVASVMLAAYNMANLPAKVGIDLQASGEYAFVVARGVAVMGPLAVTAACLLLMFCSRKVLYPWLVSLFSLTLPILLLITNIFPA